MFKSDTKEWIMVHINVSASVIYSMRTGQENPKPTERRNLVRWKHTTPTSSVIFLVTNRGATIVVGDKRGEKPRRKTRRWTDGNTMFSRLHRTPLAISHVRRHARKWPIPS